MKIVTILLLLLFASAAYGELTKEDLRDLKEDLHKIIKEENAASEKRTREYIDLKIDALDQKLSARIDGVEKNLNAKIEAVDQRIDDMRIVMIALVGLIAAAVALPQVIIAYIERKREKEIHLLVQQLREKNGVPPSSS